MYLSYYNLNERPFQINSDPRFLWLGEQHNEALATLIYGVQDHRGFLLLTGDIGTGKTTLVNALLEKLDDSILVGNITDPKLELIGFLNMVSASVGCPEKSEKKEEVIQSFTRFLNEKYAEKKYVLLIIDEAHTLSVDHLEQIRLLSNIELPERRLISIFLVGQDELNETLTSYECRALRQRISLICRVEPLSEGDTTEYIRYRLRIAGTDRQLFSQAAVREIQRFSRGYPRLINNLCDHALLTGYVRQLRKITPGVIKECGQEMLLPGEHIESSLQMLSENLEKLSSLNSRDHSEMSEQKRLWKSGRKIRRNSARILELWSRLRVKSSFYWALWACVAVVILSFTLIFNTSLFSSRDREETALSAKRAPAVQVLPPSSITTALPVDTPIVENEEPQIKTVPDAVSAKPKNLPKAETLPHTSDGEKEPHPAGFGMQKAKEKSIVDSVEHALRNQHFKRAIELSEEFIAGDASPPPRLKALYSESLVEQAKILSEKEISSSEDLLNKAILADPDNLTALLLLGKLYTGQKQYGKALETYQKATGLNPNMPGLFFNMGFLYAAEENYPLAEGAFARAIELTPPYLDKALFNLAVVQDKQGKRDASLQSLKKALEVNPNNQKAHDLLERLTGSSGDGS